jgi:hypothetical protein
MKDLNKRSSNDIRRQHNADLIRRMRSGDSLTSFDSKASWYPPRPIIKKDTREMERVYRADTRSTPARPAAADGLRILTLQPGRGDDGRGGGPVGEAS